MNALNSHFSDSPMLPDPKADPISYSSSVPEFSFRNVTSDEVASAFKSVRSDAVGSDLIPRKFLVFLLPFIVDHVTYFFNHILTTSKFPLTWKSAIVTPLAKIPCPSALSDFRPISVLPVLSKVLEILMRNQISEHIANNNLLDPFQSGFRKAHSCETALLKVVEDIRSGIEHGKCTIMVLLDFRNAFGSVPHIHFINKLKAFFNFSSSACALVLSYLGGRSQSVVHNKSKSDPLPVTSGVPQGSVLGPTFFSLFINDLPKKLNLCLHHLFADDFQIYFQSDLGEALISSISTINAELVRISEWSSSNGIFLNPKKSQAIIIYKEEIPTDPIPPILVDGVVVPYSSKVKNLGVIFDNKFTWEFNISQICRRVYYSLHSLRRLSNFTPSYLKRRLAHALVLPHLFYCSSIFTSSITSSLSKKLQIAYNACVRYVHNLKPRQSVRNFNLLFLPLPKHYDFRALKFIFQIRHGLLPTYLNSFFHYAASNRSNAFLIPRHRTATMARSFSISGARLWNSLPVSIRALPTLGRFLSAVDRHFESNEYI